jgi:cell wall-associated NlpC family hydrolase
MEVTYIKLHIIRFFSVLAVASAVIINIAATPTKPVMTAGTEHNNASNVPPDSIKGVAPNADSLRMSKIDSVISYGKKFLGLRYKYSGYNELGFDCSGYVSYIYGKFGCKLPHSSAAMATLGEKVDMKDARKGDLIYFKGRSTKGTRVGHVALIVEADSGQIKMMHSACQSGVIIEKYNHNDYYTRRFLMIKRIKL